MQRNNKGSVFVGNCRIIVEKTFFSSNFFGIKTIFKIIRYNDNVVVMICNFFF